MDKGGGYVEYPRLSTPGGEGVKIGQNLVHVVVECPLRLHQFILKFTDLYLHKYLIGLLIYTLISELRNQFLFQTLEKVLQTLIFGGSPTFKNLRWSC